ncbi:MAG: Putative esterase [uncultured Rubrobacteraceae bacterium]|uniref:Esterase n=1 Tax=uncultured Rubrobacteraceae bacterium TaxID=349277 RepID=A0A6J4RD93_9ACTN|nr:MAG: Putative esterase [uncultured Rubrobacteraceae bacterium]
MPKLDATRTPIHGDVAPGFEEVRREFEKNFAERGELGAACAIYHEGEKVVDLWGGYRDAERREPWEQDTLILVYSVSKGLTAMAIAAAHGKGLIDLDERVATYWPEFAQNGKQDVTVRHLLAHQAGVPTVNETLTVEKMADPEWLADAIVAQQPAWEPGTQRGYHYLTIGWCSAELIRRVDPQRRGFARFFREEVAEPLGIEFYFGVPEDTSPERIAEIKAFHGTRMLLHMNSMPAGMVLAFFWPRSLTNRVLGNPKISSPGMLDSPEYRKLELPAANGYGNVRGIAGAFGDLATGGHRLGLPAGTVDEVTALAEVPADSERDLVWHADLRFSMGFIKPSRLFRFGSSVRAFGAEGAGGSFAFADPDTQVGFAYAPNRLGFSIADDPREKALRDALYGSLGRLASYRPGRAE